MAGCHDVDDDDWSFGPCSCLSVLKTRRGGLRSVTSTPDIPHVSTPSRHRALHCIDSSQYGSQGTFGSAGS
jgi:hypothetical protein